MLSHDANFLNMLLTLSRRSVLKTSKTNCYIPTCLNWFWFGFMVFSANFNNISVISWWSVLFLVVTNTTWKTTWRNETHFFGGDIYIWLYNRYKCDYHKIIAMMTSSSIEFMRYCYTHVFDDDGFHCLYICLIQHYVIMFVSDLRQVGGFLQFLPPIKLTATI